jgi:endoglucanase
VFARFRSDRTKGSPLKHSRLNPLRLLLALCTAVLLAAASTAPATAAAPVTAAAPAASAATSRAMSVVAAMQPSTNIGNTLDAIPDETSWGNPAITKALFDTLKAQGFHSVRIPVTWSNHQSTTAPYTIDATFLARVKQVVDWAIADGLYVDLNVHHDSWQWLAAMPTDHDNVLARFNATWTQIATEFKDAPSKLLFESVNEPSFTDVTDAQKITLLDELNTSFHSVVRGTGGRNATRMLILPTVGCTPSQSFMDALAATMASFNDTNLIATVHFYSFWPFSVNIAGYTTFNAATQQDLVDTFTRMHDTFVAKGIPVYVGEYGLLSYPDYTHPGIVEAGEALKYVEMLGYEARLNGVTTALWDAGNYLNRHTLQWRDADLFAQIKSSWQGRSGTASSDQVYVPKSATITDHTLTLNLNGTTFQGLWQGSAKLREGTDYRVSGDQLTLTATALTRLTGTRAYGVDTTVQARFSGGVPWNIAIITSDTPVLSAATGTTSSFAIPTQFRGDQLATMEAKYADGSNAGPANWTSYQQFSTAFAPDYTAGTLSLTPAFFDSLTDGAPVTLTFHFWSGAGVTYQVTKSGTSVIGTTP